MRLSRITAAIDESQELGEPAVTLLAPTNVPYLRRLQQLIRAASLQTVKLQQISQTSVDFSAQSTSFENSIKLLVIAVRGFLSKNDNASNPAAKGMAEVAQHLLSSAPHVSLAASDCFKDPLDRTKAIDLTRACAHLKMVLASLQRMVALHPPPEPEPLSGKPNAADSVFGLSRRIVQSIASFTEAAQQQQPQLATRVQDCREIHSMSLQLVAMVRAYATDKVASTRRLQRLLGLAAKVRILAGQLLSYQRLLAREADEGIFTKGVDADGRLAGSARELASTVLELNQTISSWITRHKEMKKIKNVHEVDIWAEEPEAPGTVLYFQDQLVQGKNPAGSGAALRAGTLNQLIMRLTSETRHDLSFVKAMIVTLRSYTTPEKMFKKLIQRYFVPPEKRPAEVSPIQWDQTVVMPIRLRVLNFLRFWIELRFSDFDYSMMKLLNSFIESQVSAAGQLARFADNLTNMVRKKIDQLQAERSVISNLPPEVKNMDPARHAELVATISDEQMANVLTLVEQNIFQKIEDSELLNQAWNKPKLKHRAPHVLALIQRFNDVSNWAVSTILSVERLKPRARMLAKFINVTAMLFRMNNFNTGYAFAIALGHQALTRMKHTFAEIPAALLNELENAKKNMAPEHGYKRYRALLKAAPMPRLPYLGVMLSDLTLVEEGNPDDIDGLIHYKKRELIYNIIAGLAQHQIESYRITAEKSVVDLFTHLPMHDPNHFRNLSKELEPPNVEKSALRGGQD